MPNTQINDARLNALQNSKYKNWQDAYAEYSGRRGSNKERREFKKDWRSQDNVKARVGEDNYNQLRAEAEQRQFGAQGYNSGSAGERRRFDRRFDKNVSNGNLRIRQTLQIPQTSTTSTTNGTVIYPWMWDTYKVRPRGVMFSQFFTPATIPAVQTPVVTPATPEVPATPAVSVATPETPAAQTPVAQTPIATPVVIPETPIVQVTSTPITSLEQAYLENLENPSVSSTNKKFDINDSEYFRAPHAFANGNGGSRIITVNGKKYRIGVTKNNLAENYGLEEDQTYAYDKTTGRFIKVKENMFGAVSGGFDNAQFEGDWIDPNSYYQKRQAWLEKNPEPQQYPTYGAQRFTPEWIEWNKKYKEISPSFYKKQGGKMNKIKYFQQGGAVPQQQDVQQQIIQLVQAAMQGDQQATQTIQQVMQAAEQGDQQAQQLAQMIQQVAEQMKGQATMAKWGSKLKYIKSLKYAKGGKTCLECQQGGDISTTHNNSLKNPLKKSINKVEEKACGGKTKKIKK